MNQRWIGRLPAPRKKMRRVSARSALLPSRGQLRNHAHIFLIDRWNVRMERGGGSGRRRLGGLVHVHWTCVYSSGPTRRALAGSVYFFQQPDNGRAAWQSPLGRTFLLYTQINEIFNSKLPNLNNSKWQPKPEGGKININDFSVM